MIVRAAGLMACCTTCDVQSDQLNPRPRSNLDDACRTFGVEDDGARLLSLDRHVPVEAQRCVL